MESFLLALIVIVGFFVTIAIFLRPEYGLLILVFAIFTRFSDILIRSYGVPSFEKIYIPLLGMIFLIRWGIFREKPIAWYSVLVFLITNFVLGLISMLYAEFPDRVEIALTRLSKDIVTIIIIVGLMTRVQSIRNIAWVFLAGGLIFGTVTSIQFLMGLHGLNFGGFVKAIPGGGYYRYTGLGILPNEYAQRLLFIIPLALDRAWNEKKFLLKILAGWIFATCTIAIVATYSRGAFIGYVSVIALMMLFTKRAKISIVIFVILFGSIIYQYVPNEYIKRIETLSEFTSNSDINLIEGSSFRGRISENIIAWRMFVDHPLLGVGLNNYQPHYLSYSRELGIDSRLEERSPHSLFLEILAEQGIVGFLWLFTLIISTLSGLRQAQKKFIYAGLPDYANLSLAFLWGILGYLITGFFLHISHFVYFLMIFGIALAIPALSKQALSEEYFEKKVTDDYIFQYS